MKTTWLVQDRNMTPSFIQNNIDLLDRLELPYTSIWINKDGKIEGLDNIKNERYIVRSGTKIINAITDANTIQDLLPNIDFVDDSLGQSVLMNLKNGVFFNKQHFEFSHYQQYDLPLLNKNVEYLSYHQQGEKTYSQPMFVKPNEDNKFFTGAIMPSHMKISDFVKNNHPMNYKEDQILIAAPIQNIEAEYRFFIVDGEVVTHSGYRSMGIANFFREAPPGLLELAKEYASLYQPHEVFVMDLAQVNGKYKIIEYNCLNGCALYAGDSAKLFFTLNDYIENKSNKLPIIKNLKI